MKWLEECRLQLTHHTFGSNHVRMIVFTNSMYLKVHSLISCMNL